MVYGDRYIHPEPISMIFPAAVPLHTIFRTSQAMEWWVSFYPTPIQPLLAVRRGLGFKKSVCRTRASSQASKGSHSLIEICDQCSPPQAKTGPTSPDLPQRLPWISSALSISIHIHGRKIDSIHIHPYTIYTQKMACDPCHSLHIFWLNCVFHPYTSIHRKKYPFRYC